MLLLIQGGSLNVVFRQVPFKTELRKMVTYEC